MSHGGRQYFEEIRVAVIASLGMVLASDPLADVVVLASREGDVSSVATLPRPQVIEFLRRAGIRSLLEIADRIASLPSSPAARWLVMVTPEFSTSTSVVLVDTGSGPGGPGPSARHPGREEAS